MTSQEQISGKNNSFQNDFLIISNKKNIISFIKKSIGEGPEIQIISQIVERNILFSAFVFLDTSSIDQEDILEFKDLLLSQKSKIILVIPFAENINSVKMLASICPNVIPYPSDSSKAKQFISNLLILENLNQDEGLDSKFMLEMYPELNMLVGVSKHIAFVKQKIIRCAKNKSPVLLLGETGTGKSTVARLIHNISDRSSRPYFQLNISNLQENLADSNLFGTVSGAFTDARETAGVVKTYDTGTLFIDEISTAPISVQSKLLVFIDTGEYISVGSEKVQHSDVRLIFATNDNLKLKILQGSFRKDLFYRMRGEVISLLPLRERPEDISVIAKEIAKKHGCEITEAGIEKLENHNWPGNVRELQFCIESACNRGNPQIDSQDLECYN